MFIRDLQCDRLCAKHVTCVTFSPHSHSRERPSVIISFDKWELRLPQQGGDSNPTSCSLKPMIKASMSIMGLWEIWKSSRKHKPIVTKANQSRWHAQALSPRASHSSQRSVNNDHQQLRSLIALCMSITGNSLGLGLLCEVHLYELCHESAGCCCTGTTLSDFVIMS